MTNKMMAINNNHTYSGYMEFSEAFNTETSFFPLNLVKCLMLFFDFCSHSLKSKFKDIYIITVKATDIYTYYYLHLVEYFPHASN